MRMRSAFLATAILITEPSMVSADCRAIHQVALMYADLTALHRTADPGRQTNRVAALRLHLEGLNEAMLAQTLSLHPTVDDIAAVTHLILTAQTVTRAASQTQSVRTSLQSPDLDQMLEATANGIPHFYCAEATAIVRQIDAEIVPKDGAAAGNARLDGHAPKQEPATRIAYPMLLLWFMVLLSGGGTIWWHVHKWLGLRQRRARRYTTNIATHMAIGEGQSEIACTLLDLSCHGAKLRFDAAPQISPHAAVSLKLQDNWHKADVRWANSHYLGLHFHTRLSRAAVQDLLRKRGMPTTQKAAPLPEPPSPPKRA